MAMKQFGIANMEDDIAEWKAEAEERDSIAEIRAAVARGWCSPESSHRVMDAALAESIVQEIVKLAHKWADK